MFTTFSGDVIKKCYQNDVRRGAGDTGWWCSGLLSQTVGGCGGGGAKIVDIVDNTLDLVVRNPSYHVSEDGF